jgi:hypothetical protein
MLESFLVAGRQEPGDPAALTYGQSVTDACMDIEMTAAVLETLAASVARRRQSTAELSGTDRADSARHPPLARTSPAPEHRRGASHQTGPTQSRETVVTVGH